MTLNYVIKYKEIDIFKFFSTKLSYSIIRRIYTYFEASDVLNFLTTKNSTGMFWSI